MVKYNDAPLAQVMHEICDQAGINGYRFTISGDPGSYQGPVNGRVLVMIDIPGEEQFYIPINGIVRKIN